MNPWGLLLIFLGIVFMWEAALGDPAHLFSVVTGTNVAGGASGGSSGGSPPAIHLPGGGSIPLPGGNSVPPGTPVQIA